MAWRVRLVERSCRGAVPGDVADREEVRVARLPGVVEIAADLGALAGRAVACDDLRARRLCQRAGQQALLQGVRDVVLGAVETRVVDRQRGAAREILGDGEVLLREAPPGLGRGQRERAEHAPAARERRHDRRAHAEDARQPEQLLVGRLLLGEPGRYVPDQLGAARAEGGRDPAGRPRARTGRRACSRRARRAVSGLAVRDADVADLAVIEHVDRAPVGQARHRELDELGRASAAGRATR